MDLEKIKSFGQSLVQRISFVDIIAFALSAIIAGLFLSWLPSSFFIKQGFRISSQQLIPVEMPEAIARIQPDLPKPMTCQPKGEKQFFCQAEVDSRNEVGQLKKALANLAPLGWVPRKALIDKMEKQLKTIEQLRMQISEINQSIEASRENIEKDGQPEVEKLREKKQDLEYEITQLKSQKKMLQEALPEQDDPDRLETFEKKIASVNTRLGTLKDTLNQLIPEYEEKAGPYLELDRLNEEKQTLKKQLDSALVAATQWEEYLQSRSGQSPLPNPDDYQVSTIPDSFQSKPLRSPEHLIYLLPLSLILFGLWRKAWEWKIKKWPPDDKKSEEQTQQLDLSKVSNEELARHIEKALDMPYLGDI